MCRLFLVSGCSNMESKPQQSLKYIIWCIDCSISITDGKAHSNVALGCIKNPGMEEIWKKQGKKKTYFICFTYRDNAPTRPGFSRRCRIIVPVCTYRPFSFPLPRMAEPQTKSQQSTDKVTRCFSYCYGRSKAGIAKCIKSCLTNNLAGKRSCFIIVISLQCTYTSSPSKCGFGCVDPGEKPCDRPGGLIT
jgi:hypothetical protein